MSTAFQQAACACTFWAGLEYMNLVPAPDADERRRIFRVRKDTDLPWVNAARKPSLRGGPKHYKGQIAYCGLFPKLEFTTDLRGMLRAPHVDPKAMRIRGEAACLLIPLDDTGRICGELFISSLPWLMGRLQAHIRTGRSPDKLDLDGFDLYEEELARDVRELLEKLMLVEEQAPAIPPMKREGLEVRSMPVKLPALTETGRTSTTQVAGASAMASDGKLAGSPEMKPIELAHIQEILGLIWEKSGWSPAHPTAEAMRIKVVNLRPRIDKSIDMKAMNSLVAGDVWRVRKIVATGEPLGPAASAYLRLLKSPKRHDVRAAGPNGGLQHFVSMLSPDKMPLGAWPDFPLVSAQQFAVDMSRQHLSGGGLYGVNGPPGTGKSTLLRDVIADQLVLRAEVMAGFDKPMDAFGDARMSIPGNDWGYLQLKPEMLGHGIVIASSNNGAVENVIKDLPKLSEPMRRSEATYFRQVAESIATGPLRKDEPQHREVDSAWGLVAALMGNSANRGDFISRFWFEAEASPGQPPDPRRLRSLPGVIKDGSHGALTWGNAKERFLNAKKSAHTRAKRLTRSIELHKELGRKRAEFSSLSRLLAGERAQHKTDLSSYRKTESEVEDAATRLQAYTRGLELANLLARSQQDLASAKQRVSSLPAPAQAQAALEAARSDADAAMQQCTILLSTKPGFFERLFNWKANGLWRSRLDKATDASAAAQRATGLARSQLQHTSQAVEQLKACEKAFQDAKTERDSHAVKAQSLGLPSALTTEFEAVLQGDHNEARRNHEKSASALRSRIRSIAELEGRLTAMQAAVAAHESEWSGFADLQNDLGESFYRQCDLMSMRDDELQRLVAYKDDTLRKLRVEVFCAAMHLNQSFVVEAWKKLSINLRLFADYMKGKISPSQLGDGSLHLWNSFFLVVPVVSSTFASIRNLFAGLGSEQIGMLLIDEAGQSTPQNALGAIWRSRRVIAVGDPLQLEPVVPHPIDALDAWREWVGADSSWAPPKCSTQALADQMTPYGTTLAPADRPEVWVGSPLRVHRRCLSPMFDVANKIAYDNLMVHGVKDTTKHDDWLGRSQWHDVAGSSEGHWVPEQGKHVVHLIRQLLQTPKLNGRLKTEKGDWHINVITPYKEVADACSSMLRDEFGEVEDIHRMTGTVHTFQGKEADVVILLLGGNPDKASAVSFFAGNEQAPNLLNVALTRAKMRLYVVGDKSLWTKSSGTFRELAQQLDDPSTRGAPEGETTRA